MKGCKVIVAGTDADRVRLEIAKKLGADVRVNVSVENLADMINRETNGRGADVVPLSRWKEASEIFETKQGGKVLLTYDE